MRAPLTNDFLIFSPFAPHSACCIIGEVTRGWSQASEDEGREEEHGQQEGTFRRLGMKSVETWASAGLPQNSSGREELTSASHQ